MATGTHPGELSELRTELAILRARVQTLERQRRRATLPRRRLPILPVVLLIALTPLAVVAANPFTDLNEGSVHNDNIDAIYSAGVTKGCVPDQEFCPNANVTREEMASFLARLGGLGTNPPVANAKTAQTAANAAQLGGQPASAYVLNGSSPTFANLTVTGDIQRAYTTGTTSRAVPIAYGSIKSDGTILSGTPNFTAGYSAARMEFVITIAGEDYDFTRYATVVTVNGAEAFPFTGSVNGHLIITARDLLGNFAIGDGFSFVTYKP